MALKWQSAWTINYNVMGSNFDSGYHEYISQSGYKKLIDIAIWLSFIYYRNVDIKCRKLETNMMKINK